MKIKLVGILLIIVILLSLSFNQVYANEIVENDEEEMKSRIIYKVFFLGILNEPIILLEKDLEIDAKVLFRIVYDRYMFRQLSLEFHLNTNIDISYGASGDNVEFNFVGYYTDSFVCGILTYNFNF